MAPLIVILPKSQRGENGKQPTTTTKEQGNWAGLPNNFIVIQLVENNETGEVI